MEIVMEDRAEDATEDGEFTPHPKVKISAHDTLRKSRVSIEEIVSKMLSIKKEAKPKHEIRELVTEMLLSFVTLRQANRSILLEEDFVKAETERAKAPVDFTTLQLHNLMYEKNHYAKAIKACKDFKSKHPDIQLVPEEEFSRDAPEEIKSSETSNDKAHNLMLKRLNFELLQRKELCKLRESLEQRKQKLLETIASRKKFLSSLPSHLKSLKKASLPVQHQLGVLQTKKLKQHHLAELLPPPLYVIYSQFLAQKEAFEENIDTEIVGSVKDAQAFARQHANKNNGIPNSQENCKLEDDVPEEEDEGQRRRKRPKKAPVKENLNQTGLYQTHPLKTILHIYDDKGSDVNSAKLITLKFEYLLKLNVVCVGIEGSNEGPERNILCNLFPNDTGDELPHQSAKLRVGDLTYDEKKTSRPYKWVQHLAGIDFLPEVSPFLAVGDNQGNDVDKKDGFLSGLSLYRQENRVQTVVQRIRSRKKAQLVLEEQFDSLSKLNWPSLTFLSIPWASHTPLCSFSSWTQVGSSLNYSTSLHVVGTEQSPVPINTDVGGRSGSSKDETDNAKEDGELPSLALVSNVANGNDRTPSKRPDLEHSKRLSLISKSMVSPIGMLKSQSFKINDEDLELMLDSESDIDAPIQIDQESGSAAVTACYKMVENSWAAYGIKHYCLVLTKTLDNNIIIRLEAQVKISMEYPLRPPHFSLRLIPMFEENSFDTDGSEWYNELRVMEAEVNVHMLKSIPPDDENFVLSHQVRFLAMLFDLYVDEGGAASSEKKRKSSTSVIDVGLCKPIGGRLLARTYRGRDHRKVISWKQSGCTPGYPC